MEEELTWQPGVEDWEKISIESYKFVIEQAKERFNDVIQESDTITKRGMTILLSYVVALSSLLSYIFSETHKMRNNGITIGVIPIIGLLSIYAFNLLFRIISSKGINFRGSPPREIFYQNVFEGLTDEAGLKRLLYNEIERIQDKIEKVKKLNDVRIKQYSTVLRISLIFVAIVIFTIVKIIFTNL